MLKSSTTATASCHHQWTLNSRRWSIWRTIWTTRDWPQSWAAQKTCCLKRITIPPAHPHPPPAPKTTKMLAATPQRSTPRLVAIAPPTAACPPLHRHPPLPRGRMKRSTNYQWGKGRPAPPTGILQTTVSPTTSWASQKHLSGKTQWPAVFSQNAPAWNLGQIIHSCLENMSLHRSSKSSLRVFLYVRAQEWILLWYYFPFSHTFNLKQTQEQVHCKLYCNGATFKG